MPKLLIIDAFSLLICEKNVANYSLLWCKTFSLKIWVCKIFDKFHVCCPNWLTDFAVVVINLPYHSQIHVGRHHHKWQKVLHCYPSKLDGITRPYHKSFDKQVAAVFSVSVNIDFDFWLSFSSFMKDTKCEHFSMRSFPCKAKKMRLK